MRHHRSICLLFFASTFLLVSTSSVSARLIRHWSYQELFDKSDIVVIATPIATNDTEEHVNLPGLAAQRVVGVETEFTISVVLKGDKVLKTFLLHHYRADADRTIAVPNGPNLVSFAQDKQTYLVFLVREADGRYAPTVGQVDPGMHGIHGLGGAEK